MLLVHQAGFVKIGEVIRYTLTYTPTYDRILPSPAELHVKIKNTSAIPLRAAYLHGPYTLHVSTYPSTFNPNQRTESPKHDGTPDYEPNLKAGGQWTSTLLVPQGIRESGEKVNSKRNLDGSPKTVKWIIEISSQILFSNSASVHYELLVGRDERSVDLGFAAAASRGHGEPGSVNDFKVNVGRRDAGGLTMPKGVYSRAVELAVEDTAALWDKPALPQWQNNESTSSTNAGMQQWGSAPVPERQRKPKKLHLVILTHGLHSNVGADLLYLKESIDATAMKARIEVRKKREGHSQDSNAQDTTHKAGAARGRDARDDKSTAPAPQSGGQDRLQGENGDEEDSDDEQVVVRGFAGNSARTERGIQYLGKRLAKFVLTTTYPDQPFLPQSRSMRRSLTGSYSSSSGKSPRYGGPSQEGTSYHSTDAHTGKLPYTFTSISFIGHSLGGLVQMYAIAYIHKHSPEFFTRIKPVNFVAMASPLLGLSNENPMYVKFALDFGLVGRTGQDLGLTWRPPTIARSGWRAVLDFGSSSGTEQGKHEDPRAKPLLRILPTGPAHQVLKMFRNRTVYSNVVNDGIVPLRTSCLLFLDWRGLDRVENARRDNGLIGTMASFGWAELTGANASSHRANTTRIPEYDTPQESDDENSRPSGGKRTDVPQPDIDATTDDNKAQQEPLPHQFLSHDQRQQHGQEEASKQTGMAEGEISEHASNTSGPLTGLLNLFRPAQANQSKSPKQSSKVKKAYSRAQTIKPNEGQSDHSVAAESSHETPTKRPLASRGDSLVEDPSGPPPKTSVFEAAGDILNPPLPPLSWLIDPSSRSRTIFHDRVYHPEDIPPSPPAKRPLLRRSFSSANESVSDQIASDVTVDDSGMKVEEKIARAYHRELSWRKVLVRLEPDAHNNMIVRRIFANAYGWDVIKHLCDTHFADTEEANTKDADEPSVERAKTSSEPVDEDGGQLRDHKFGDHLQRTRSENSDAREAADKVPSLESQAHRVDELASSSNARPRTNSWQRQDSAVWHDSIFDETGDEDEDGDDEPLNPFQQFQRYWNGTAQEDQNANGNANQHHQSQQAWAPNRRGPSLDTDSSRLHPSVADTLTQSPVQAVSPMSGGSHQFRGTSRTSLDRLSGTSELGLMRPPEAHLAESQSAIGAAEEPSGPEGVAKRVARLSTTDQG